ncbi:MAG: hypothetical protein ACM3WV_06050 [Bacillota bacterium]
MSVTLNLTPFSDYWMDCRLNNIFSVIISRESSYKAAAYMNNYSYLKHTGDYEKIIYFNLMDVKYLHAFEKTIEECILRYEPYLMSRDENITKQLIEPIKKYKHVFLNVDLFYWIPGNLTYGHSHCDHYSLITGYDDNKKEYRAFDDDVKGYGLHLVPEERLIKAFLNSKYKDPPAFILYLRDEFQEYRLNISQVCRNAGRLIDELAAFDVTGMWEVREGCDEMKKPEAYQGVMTAYITGATKIMNRQIGNKLLFKYLFSLKHLKECHLTRLVNYADSLAKEWQKIKNILIRAKLSSKVCNLNYLRQHAFHLLSTEEAMWRDFLLFNEAIALLP